jgi:tetratricopeptide (TPR) repeat protein
MTAGPTVEERLRHRLQQHVERCTARAVRIYTPVLHDYARRAHPPDAVDSYVSVLRNADAHAARDDELLQFVYALGELLANIGGGRQFSGQEELLDLFERLTDELNAAGCATTDLRLITARYCSAISTGGDRRLRLITHALKESRTDDELLRALLVIAKFHIDISDYDNAHRYLDDCLVVAARALTGPAQRYDISTTRGIIYYFHDHTAATQYFLQGIALDPTITDPVICRSTASALHHLGGIKATHGDNETALALMVLAQHYKARTALEGTQFGHYHLRLGEILFANGAAEPARWHLEQASRIFHSVQERSNAEGHLSSALAGIAAASGEHKQAIHLLRGAIRAAQRDRYARGELLYRYQLVSLYLRRARLLAALSTALPGLRAWRAARISGWRWIVQHLRSRRFPPRPIEPDKRGTSTLSCPCPEHDALSVGALITRCGLTDLVHTPERP